MSTFSSRACLLLLILLVLFTPFALRDSGDEIAPAPLFVTDLAIGNSHTQAINFASMGLTGHIASRNGADLLAVSNILNKNIDRYPNLKRLWIPVGPFLFERYLKRSLFLPLLRVLPQDLALKIIYLEREIRLNIVEWNQIRIRLKSWLHQIKSSDQTVHSGTPIFFNEGRANSFYSISPEDIELMAEMTISGFRYTFNRNPKLGYTLLLGLLEVAEQRGIDVIFFTPPFMSEYYNDPRLVPDVDSLNTRMERIARTHPDVYFFDENDFFPRGDTHHFQDSNHLNFYGAVAFSPHLYKRYADAKSAGR